LVVRVAIPAMTTGFWKSTFLGTELDSFRVFSRRKVQATHRLHTKMQKGGAPCRPLRPGLAGPGLM